MAAQDTRQVSDLVSKRWTRYGKDRVYVSTSGGARVGWLDLQDGSQHLELPGHGDAFAAALQPFLPAADVLWPAPVEPSSDEPTGPETQPSPVAEQRTWKDLADQRPGELVRAEAEARREDMRERSRVGTFLARAFDVKTDERAYRVGAKGEEAVGARLECLLDRGWHVLHSIPVGKGKSDIDPC